MAHAGARAGPLRADRVGSPSDGDFRVAANSGYVAAPTDGTGHDLACSTNVAALAAANTCATARTSD